MIHAAAWLGWAGGTLVILSTTRNPWYVGLTLVCIAVVRAAVRKRGDGSPPIPISMTRFGLVVIGFSAIFNALTVHFGRTVLFSLPEAIPFLGGVVTLEAVVYGAVNGLVLTGLFAAFTVFNQAISIRQLVRLVPRAFFPVAVVTSIAMTFVPVTLRQYRAIREAQAVRGHRLRGLRDWLPLLMPLLTGGLERAFQLAEAMTARGFAATESTPNNLYLRLITLTGLTLLTVGWLLRLVWGFSQSGLVILLVGLGMVIGALWLMGRRVPRTNYRPQLWTGRDWLVVIVTGAAALTFAAPWPGLDRSSLFFYPYPVLNWPPFQPFFGVALLGLLLPGLLILHRPAPEAVAVRHIFSMDSHHDSI